MFFIWFGLFILCFLFTQFLTSFEFASKTTFWKQIQTQPDSIPDSNLHVFSFFSVFLQISHVFPSKSAFCSQVFFLLLIIWFLLFVCCFFLSFFKHVCFFSKTAKAARGKANPDSTKDSIPDSNLQVSQFLHFSASCPSVSFKLTCCSQFVFSLFFWVFCWIDVFQLLFFPMCFLVVFLG